MKERCQAAVLQSATSMVTVMPMLQWGCRALITGRGAVGIIYGDADGMDLDNPDLSTRTRLTEGAVVGFGFERDGDQLGYAVAAGEFDGDGFR